jgi:hypothetical protein
MTVKYRNINRKVIMKNGKVYVVHNEWIQDPETGEMPYKIGITKNTVDDRYYGLGLKMPGEFICNFAYEFGENYTLVEKALHKLLNTLNVNGEWFNINDDVLDGIRDICVLAGGKLITEIVENEIEKKINVIEKNQDFENIVKKWNSIATSDNQAIGESPRRRNIWISEIKTDIHYRFLLKNTKEISIQLICSTKAHFDFDQVLESFNGLKINGHIFIYPPLTNREIKNGWKGKIKTDISIKEIDDIVNTMKILIEQTKPTIIERYK